MIEPLRKISRRILKHAKNLPLQVFIRAKKGALVRFTNNGVHQNTSQDLFSYTLRQGPVWAESNDLSDEGIQETLRRISLISENPSASKKTNRRVAYKSIKENFPLHLQKIPQTAAQVIQKAVRLIRARQASANGYFSAYERSFYLADNDGLEAFHPATAVRFGTTLTKGSGKGYFSFYHPDPKKLDVDSVVEEAAGLAEFASRSEVSLKPGEYECVFSPRAFLELIEPLRRHFDRQLCTDQKSVFSGFQGKKIFSEYFSLHDDVGHAGQFGIPFDAEGKPKRKVVLVHQGILKELLSEGHSTRGLLEHPVYPQNLVVPRGTLSRDEIFKRIRRGIFINKIWYHTLVRESEMEATGLATAGSLFIDKGHIQGRVVNLRYHDSLFSILRSVVAASREQVLLKDGEMGAALLPYLWVSRLRVVA